MSSPSNVQAEVKVHSDTLEEDICTTIVKH